MSLAASGRGQNLVCEEGGGGLFCILALVPGKVTWEIDLWSEC